MTASDFDHFIEQYHHALDEIWKGNPEGYYRLYSRRDDVTLANPFGPPVQGWEQVAQTIAQAAIIFREGEVTGFERIATCMTPELAYIVEMERGQTKVGGAADTTPIALRVTSIFRPEDGTWKIVHRHADPITVPQSAQSVIQQ
jgi:ketosteroid isomerase-like protein